MAPWAPLKLPGCSFPCLPRASPLPASPCLVRPPARLLCIFSHELPSVNDAFHRLHQTWPLIQHQVRRIGRDATAAAPLGTRQGATTFSQKAGRPGIAPRRDWTHTHTDNHDGGRPVAAAAGTPGSTIKLVSPHGQSTFVAGGAGPNTGNCFLLPHPATAHHSRHIERGGVRAQEEATVCAVRRRDLSGGNREKKAEREEASAGHARAARQPASQPAIQWTTGSAEALIMSPRLCSVCGRTPTSLPGTGHANQACRAVQHRGPIHTVWPSVSLSLPECRGEAQAIGPPMDRCRHFSLGGP